MIHSHSVLAVIPARAGSKGIAGKNMSLVSGRPLIQWTIDAAFASAYVDRVVVTTDDPLVRRLATGQGVTVLSRPPHLAEDTTTAAEVIAHVLEQAFTEELIVYLQPTSPLRRGEDIDGCLDLLVSTRVQGVVSVTAVREAPEWMYRFKIGSAEIQPLIMDHRAYRRQDLPDTVRLNGAVYCASQQALRPDGNFMRLLLAGYEMPGTFSIDIDEPGDLEAAERAIEGRCSPS